ncbi:MAG: hypothetical protein C0601_02190, partial [Candidatus Muiribacterium halophilum]
HEEETAPVSVDENVIEIDTSDSEDVDLSSFIADTPSEPEEDNTVNIETPHEEETAPVSVDENVIEIDTSDSEDVDLSSFLDSSNESEDVTSQQEVIHPIEVDKKDNMIELEDVGDVNLNELIEEEENNLTQNTTAKEDPIILDDNPEIEIITASEEEKEKDRIEKEKIELAKKEAKKDPDISSGNNDDDPFSGLDL